VEGKRDLQEKMKNIQLYFAIIFISTACVQEQEIDESVEIEEELIENHIDSILKKEIINDEVIEEFKIGTKRLVFTEDSTCFLPEKKWKEIVEDSLLTLDEMVNRKEDTLFLKLTNGDSINLINVGYDEEGLVDPISEVVEYIYNGSVDNLEYWNIFVYCYECHYTILIDKETGEKIITLGDVYVSPSVEYVLLVNEDIEAGFTSNGFQLFEVYEDKLNLIGNLEVYDWGPNQVKWISDSTLWIRQSYWGEVDMEYKFSRMAIESEIILKDE
jgi:hypothetical protein